MKACIIIRDLAWKIPSKINNQYEKVYVFRNTSNEKNKTCKKTCEVLVDSILKSTDMKLPRGMSSFLRSSSNKKFVQSCRNVIRSRKKKVGNQQK